MRRIIAAAALALAAIGAAHGEEAARLGNLVIEDRWTRASIGMSRPGAASMTIRNEGDEPDRLVGMKAPAAERTEVHDTTVSTEGVARMAPTGPLDIPAGGEAMLAPGGLHAMRMGLTAPLEVDGTLPITLAFETAGEVTVEAPILPLAARGSRS